MYVEYMSSQVAFEGDPVAAVGAEEWRLFTAFVLLMCHQIPLVLVSFVAEPAEEESCKEPSCQLDINGRRLTISF